LDRLSFLLDQPKAEPELTNSIENGAAVRKNETKKSRLGYSVSKYSRTPCSVNEFTKGIQNGFFSCLSFLLDQPRA